MSKRYRKINKSRGGREIVSDRGVRLAVNLLLDRDAQPSFDDNTEQQRQSDGILLVHRPLSFSREIPDSRILHLQEREADKKYGYGKARFHIPPLYFGHFEI